ncbi:hypothetical protein F2Q68_00004937 [Brassica cretica]|uniref:Uncharacterized protein n=1 Tax=Brassica cretica TaxID=69181 RepID=A0A8S9JF60_BRACR|nr:hypothetical protein F2Q68_00004937 [Brassica cretica]
MPSPSPVTINEITTPKVPRSHHRPLLKGYRLQTLIRRNRSRSTPPQKSDLSCTVSTQRGGERTSDRREVTRREPPTPRNLAPSETDFGPMTDNAVSDGLSVVPKQRALALLPPDEPPERDRPIRREEEDGYHQDTPKSALHRHYAQDLRREEASAAPTETPYVEDPPNPRNRRG